MSKKEEIADVLHENKVLFAMLEDYKKVIKEKCAKMLDACIDVANNTGSEKYNDMCKKLAYCLNDYIRVLHFRKMIIDDIRDNFTLLDELKNGTK